MNETFVQKARAFKAEPELIEDLALHEVNGTKVLDVLDELRPELYALVAVLGETIVDSALEHKHMYPPYGLMTHKGDAITEIPTFEDLSVHLGYALRTRGIDAQQQLIKDKSPITTRLGYLCHLFNRTHEQRYQDQYTLIAAGLTTASVQAAEGLKAVSRMVQNHEPEADTPRVAEVARNSGRLITKLAALPLSQLNGAAAILREAGQEETWGALTNYQGLHYVVGTDGAAYVDFAKPISHMPAPGNKNNESLGVAHPPAFKHQGCPATARLGDKSAVIKLWNWAIDIAEDQDLLVASDVYRHRYRLPAPLPN